MPSSSSDEKKAPALDFNALVLSLGSSVIVHLGEAPDPTTGQKRDKADFAMAQQSIDLLTMLQEKTRGNLTPDEARFLETCTSTCACSTCRSRGSAPRRG